MVKTGTFTGGAEAWRPQGDTSPCTLKSLPTPRTPSTISVLNQGPPFQRYLFHWTSEDNNVTEFREIGSSGAFPWGKKGKKTGQGVYTARTSAPPNLPCGLEQPSLSWGSVAHLWTEYHWLSSFATLGPARWTVCGESRPQRHLWKIDMPTI
jgi:hypothetical protein